MPMQYEFSDLIFPSLFFMPCLIRPARPSHVTCLSQSENSECIFSANQGTGILCKAASAILVTVSCVGILYFVITVQIQIVGTRG